jgi:hypothetical protein
LEVGTIEIYWSFIAFGVIFAVVSLILGEIIGHWIDGIAHVFHLDHMDFLSPMVVVGGVTAFGAAGLFYNSYFGITGYILVIFAALTAITLSFAKFGEAAILEMVVQMLPALAEKIAAPIGAIDKITIVDTGGSGGGATKVSKYVTELMATAPDMLKSVSGLDLESLITGFMTRKTVPTAPLEDAAASKNGIIAKSEVTPTQE